MRTHHQQLLRQLAEGVDPITGEVLPNHSPYNQPAVIRALYAALMSPKTACAKAGPLRNGHAWTDEERALVVHAFREKVTIEQIAARQQRSKGAIRSELIRQGLIKMDA